MAKALLVVRNQPTAVGKAGNMIRAANVTLACDGGQHVVTVDEMLIMATGSDTIRAEAEALVQRLVPGAATDWTEAAWFSQGTDGSVTRAENPYSWPYAPTA